MLETVSKITKEILAVVTHCFIALLDMDPAFYLTRIQIRLQEAKSMRIHADSDQNPGQALSSQIKKHTHIGNRS